ncbi:hypothetical protein [Streptococcus sp.]
MSRKLFRGAVGACSIIGAAVSAMQEEWLWAGIFLIAGLAFLYKAFLNAD